MAIKRMSWQKDDDFFEGGLRRDEYEYLCEFTPYRCSDCHHLNGLHLDGICMLCYRNQSKLNNCSGRSIRCRTYYPD